MTVEIEGVTEPAMFRDLAKALDALWVSLRALPLGSYQYEAYKDFFGPDAAERVAEFLERDGRLDLSFSMSGRSHLVRVHRAKKAAA
ncbi:hypothetical protein [Saccharothrix sp. ST-888]|uniref:hypothetical protein n=1 Tax=Saccharothrix sp. ST-888 TaxID=1427391 RepID=UPI0005EC37BA|nr:hypothetical protein [Saccharothrix sp. ST-888]KJK57712.1 hypothetical protein UK12_14695 [Saccharothrix sp. ST-888]